MSRRVLVALLCGLLFSASPAFAAIAEVGSGTQRATVRGSGVASVTIAFPANVTSGSLLLVTGAAFSTWGTLSLSDTRSTSYSSFTSAGADANSRAFIGYGIASSGGACTVTIDPPGTTYVAASIDEFSGVNATPLDVDGGETQATSTSQSDSITTVTANDLVVGVGVTAGGNNTWTNANGAFTVIDSESDYNTYSSYMAVFQLATTATSYTASFTTSVSRTSTVYTAAFKPATASTTPARARGRIY